MTNTIHVIRTWDDVPNLDQPTSHDREVVVAMLDQMVLEDLYDSFWQHESAEALVDSHYDNACQRIEDLSSEWEFEFEEHDPAYTIF